MKCGVTLLKKVFVLGRDNEYCPIELKIKTRRSSIKGWIIDLNKSYINIEQAVISSSLNSLKNRIEF